MIGYFDPFYHRRLGIHNNSAYKKQENNPLLFTVIWNYRLSFAAALRPAFLPQ